jgi:hypothetical protein
VKELTIIQGTYGLGFFDGDHLIRYVHENDGEWRSEYFNPILERFGINVRYTPVTTDAQADAMDLHDSE